MNERNKKAASGTRGLRGYSAIVIRSVHRFVNGCFKVFLGQGGDCGFGIELVRFQAATSNLVLKIDGHISYTR